MYNNTQTTVKLEDDIKAILSKVDVLITYVLLPVA